MSQNAVYRPIYSIRKYDIHDNDVDNIDNTKQHFTLPLFVVLTTICVCVCVCVWPKVWPGARPNKGDSIEFEIRSNFGVL